MPQSSSCRTAPNKQARPSAIKSRSAVTAAGCLAWAAVFSIVVFKLAAGGRLSASDQTDASTDTCIFSLALHFVVVSWVVVHAAKQIEHSGLLAFLNLFNQRPRHYRLFGAQTAHFPGLLK